MSFGEGDIIEQMLEKGVRCPLCKESDEYCTHTTPHIDIFVHGIPQPQGWIKAMPYHKDNGKMGVRTFSGNKELEPWRDRVEREMRAYLNKHGLKFDPDDPIEIYTTFVFLVPQTKNKKKKGYPIYHTTKPDIDKLTRGILDSMSFATGVDDSRVCSQHSYKRYTDNPEEAGAAIFVIQFKQDYSKEE